jgi:predicted nucleic acid-binding protein
MQQVAQAAIDAYVHQPTPLRRQSVPVTGLAALFGDLPPINVTDLRARRVVRVQRVEATVSPLPFDVEAARQYGTIAADVISTGRKPHGRVADLMIASIAAANRLPLFTTSPRTFTGSNPS